MFKGQQVCSDSNRQSKLRGCFGDSLMQQKCCAFFLESVDITLFKEITVLNQTGSFCEEIHMAIHREDARGATRRSEGWKLYL